MQPPDQSQINFHEVVFRDLTADHNPRLDQQVLTGSGSARQLESLVLDGYLAGLEKADWGPSPADSPILTGVFRDRLGLQRHNSSAASLTGRPPRATLPVRTYRARSRRTSLSEAHA